MTNGVNYNIQKYMSSNTGIDKSNVQAGIEKSKQVVTNSVETNSASQVLSGLIDSENLQDSLRILPIVYFSNKLIDFLIAKQDGKGLLDIVAKFGDKISDVLKLDKIFNSKNSGKISRFLTNNRFTKYFTETYKAMPKSSIARGQIQSLSEEFAGKAISEVSKLKETIPDFGKYFNSETLSYFGLAKAKDGVKTVFSKEMADDVAKGIGKLVEENKDKISGSKLLGLKNKLNTASMNTGKSALGKLLAKSTMKTKELLTYGGDLFSLYFTANVLIRAHKASKEAPKGEKLSTFMHVLSEQYIGLLLYKPCTNILYKIGGNKYRGMTPEARAALKELVKNTNANTALTKEGLQIAKMQRKLLIKGVDKDKVAQLAGKGLKEAKELAKSLKHDGAKLKLWERPLKFLGKILDTGLDKMKITKFINIGKLKLKLPKITLGGFLGGFARFVIIMMVIQPLLQKPITKLFHKIFGEPKAYLEKQKKNEQKSNPNNTDTATQQENEQVVNPKETNLLKIYSQNQPSETANPISAQQTDLSSSSEFKESELPALNLFNKDKKQDDSEQYIPSIEVQFAPEDTSYDDARAAEMIKNADKLLARASKVVNS